MLFTEDTAFDQALTALSKLIGVTPTAPIMPLPCDRWIARSCLHKAIRRAEPELAQRALANLFEHDRRATWRHLVIIALEDVGVANIDLLTMVVAAQRSRRWRQDNGGDWIVVAELVRLMASSNHCQAACDLLLRTLNDPSREHCRAAALELDAAPLARTLWNDIGEINTSAIAALALGGELAEGQSVRDPCAVFDIFADTGVSASVTETCRTAWKISRNPMAILLPLVWQAWSNTESCDVVDDARPPVQSIALVPGYSLDQFTRVGNSALRDFVSRCPEIAATLAEAGIPRSRWTRSVGDLVFLIEGSPLVRRHVSEIGERLRQPYRMLPTVVAMEPLLESALEVVRSKTFLIASLREKHFHRLQTYPAP